MDASSPTTKPKRDETPEERKKRKEEKKAKKEAREARLKESGSESSLGDEKSKKKKKEKKEGSDGEKKEKKEKKVKKEKAEGHKVKQRTGEYKIEDDYIVKKVLGTGAFSEVRLAIRKKNDKKFAIKCINKKRVSAKDMTNLVREIEILKKIRHDHIVMLMEVLDTPETLYLVLEYADGGELFDSIIARGSYSEKDTIELVKQLLSAISYCHENDVVHRDLKPENLLLSKDAEGVEILKVADFGLSKDLGEGMLVTKCGTADYVAPEVLNGQPYTKAVDVWSVGVITYILLCGYPPFYGVNERELFDTILNARFDFPEEEWDSISETAKDFVKSMLVLDPEKRPTAQELLRNDWITGRKRKLMKTTSFSISKFQQYNVSRKNFNQ